VLPPYRIAPHLLQELRELSMRLALRLGVVGLMNVQVAIYEGEIYVLEVNPRASRTVPFIAKAVGLPLAGMAAKVMAGKTLEELGFTAEPEVPGIFVKAPVLPFQRFPGADPRLGPEMKSTGEVMGVGRTFGEAFAKSLLAAGHKLPQQGTVFLSVNDRDKPALLPIALELAALGFHLLATGGTATYLRQQGLSVDAVLKVHEGRPHVVDRLLNGEIHLVINTPLGRPSHVDDAQIRQAAIKAGVPCITTLSGAAAAVQGIAAIRHGELGVYALQEL
jgi:carbamoyl-phosphate synthase large subunit